MAFEGSSKSFSCHFGEVLFHQNHFIAIAIVVSPCGGNGAIGYLLFDLSYFFYVVGYFDIRDADDIAVVL